MQLKIASPGFDPSPALVQSVEEKFQHLAKLFERIHYCEVVLRHVKSDHQKNCSVEARMGLPRSIVFASETEESFELALSKLGDDLEHQLRKRKETLEENR